MAFARATRAGNSFRFGPAVTNSTVLAKPASSSFASIRRASRRLKSYSGTPRALVAPGSCAVWPTSRMTRNAARLHFDAGALAACALDGSAATSAAPAAASSVKPMRSRIRRIIGDKLNDRQVQVMAGLVAAIHNSR